MTRTPLSIPEIAIISGTRAALGAGVGMLLASRLNEDQRRAVGWTLIIVGGLTTIPIVAQLIRSQRDASRGTENGKTEQRFTAQEQSF